MMMFPLTVGVLLLALGAFLIPKASRGRLDRREGATLAMAHRRRARYCLRLVLVQRPVGHG